MGTFAANLPPNLNKESELALIEDAYSKSGYKMPAKWVWDKFWDTPDAVDYYIATKHCPPNATILSKDEYASVAKAVELIKVNPYTLPYFINNDITKELMHQVPIYFEYRGFEFKSLLDGVLIDHEHKTIQPFDLKTTGKSVYDFRESFVNYGYFRQAALYTYALETPESPVYELIKKGYITRDFKFIVAETKLSSTNPAVIVNTSLRDYSVG